MKIFFYSICALIIALSSCKENNVNVFDKTADQRITDAVTTLKADLIAPTNGFITKYKPANNAGSFYILMKFNDDNSVIIQTDAADNKGEFLTDTLTYRIDSSLGLQLVLQNYSFFSYLFEQDNASFPAEYEFFYVNKTPDNSLVFKSKTDTSDPTILTFTEATSDDPNLLGVKLAQDLATQASDLNKFTSSLQLIYQNKDLIFYLSLDERKRTIDFNSTSQKSNTQNYKAVNLTTTYYLKGDSMVFDAPIAGNFFGNAISIKGIKFNNLQNGTLSACGGLPIHTLNGVTSPSSDIVTLKTGLFDLTGADFQSSTFFAAALNNIYSNGSSAAAAISTDIVGAESMQLYYNYDIGSGTPFYAIGFRIVNKDATVTFALRQFTPTLNGNNIVFTFASTISIFGNPQTDANVNNIDIYLNALTQGGQTYVFKYTDKIYEFYNPCTNLSIGFVAEN